MKLKATVNLGNYENISIESSEYDNATDCCREVFNVLVAFKEPRVDDFCKKMFKGW